MSINITARHFDLTDEIRDYAEEKALEAINTFPFIERFNVIIDKQRHNYISELVIQAKGRFKAEATDMADDIRTSIDKAFEKIERQLRKHSEKSHDHRV